MSNPFFFDIFFITLLVYLQFSSPQKETSFIFILLVFSLHEPISNDIFFNFFSIFVFFARIVAITFINYKCQYFE